jgi:hypothetical protein
MLIDPTKSSGANPLPGAPVEPTGGNQAGRIKPAGTKTPQEVADINDLGSRSAEAHDAGGAEGEITGTDLSAGRLRHILKRISSGYYDTPQVRDRIAQRVHSEFGASTAQ